MPNWTADEKDFVCMVGGQGVLFMYQNIFEDSDRNKEKLETTNEMYDEMLKLCQPSMERDPDIADMYETVKGTRSLADTLGRFM